MVQKQYIGLYRKLLALEALRLYAFVRGFWINRGANISGGKSASEQAIALLIKNAFCFYSFSMKHNKWNSLVKYKLELEVSLCPEVLLSDALFVCAGVHLFLYKNIMLHVFPAQGELSYFPPILGWKYSCIILKL